MLISNGGNTQNGMKMLLLLLFLGEGLKYVYVIKYHPTRGARSTNYANVCQNNLIFFFHALKINAFLCVSRLNSDMMKFQPMKIIFTTN